MLYRALVVCVLSMVYYGCCKKIIEVPVICFYYPGIDSTYNVLIVATQRGNLSVKLDTFVDNLYVLDEGGAFVCIDLSVYLRQYGEYTDCTYDVYPDYIVAIEHSRYSDTLTDIYVEWRRHPICGCNKIKRIKYRLNGKERMADWVVVQ